MSVVKIHTDDLRRIAEAVRAQAFGGGRPGELEWAYTFLCERAGMPTGHPVTQEEPVRVPQVVPPIEGGDITAREEAEGVDSMSAVIPGVSGEDVPAVMGANTDIDDLSGIAQAAEGMGGAPAEEVAPPAPRRSRARSRQRS
jgi:hypothetical protein